MITYGIGAMINVLEKRGTAMNGRWYFKKCVGLYQTVIKFVQRNVWRLEMINVFYYDVYEEENVNLQPPNINIYMPGIYDRDRYRA